MIYHAKSVVKGTQRALVVCDMPFGSYQGNSKEALASAIRIMKESHNMWPEDRHKMYTYVLQTGGNLWRVFVVLRLRW